MEYKSSKKRKKTKKRTKREIKNDKISEDDAFVIELLYEQISSLIIFFISNTFFYRYGQYALYEAIFNGSYGEKLSAWENFIKANVFSVSASLAGVQINMERYRQQCRRKAYGKIHYSLEPERKIAVSAIMSFFLFLFQLIGGIGIYKRSFFHYESNRKELERIYNIELEAFQIRYLADYFMLKSTIMSIKLINSKYYEKNDLSHNMDNPDIPAIIAGQLYVIQRALLLYANYYVYKGLLKKYNKYEDNFLLLPNIIIIIGNIIGLFGNIIALIGFIEIYNRNVNQPIFGR